MKMFESEHPELIEGKRTSKKERTSRTRFTIVTKEPHRHRPPLCCDQIFTRPMTVTESIEYRKTKGDYIDGEG